MAGNRSRKPGVVKATGFDPSTFRQKIMAKHKPRKFLCVNGPLQGLWLTWAQGAAEGYEQYNSYSSDLKGAGWPTAILVHDSIQNANDKPKPPKTRKASDMIEIERVV